MSQGTVKAVLSGDTVLLMGEISEKKAYLRRRTKAGPAGLLCATTPAATAVKLEPPHPARQKPSARSMIASNLYRLAGATGALLRKRISSQYFLEVTRTNPTARSVSASFVPGFPRNKQPLSRALYPWFAKRPSRNPWPPSGDAALARLSRGAEAGSRSRHRGRAIRLGLPRVLAQEMHRQAGGCVPYLTLLPKIGVVSHGVFCVRRACAGALSRWWPAPGGKHMAGIAFVTSLMLFRFPSRGQPRPTSTAAVVTFRTEGRPCDGTCKQALVRAKSLEHFCCLQQDELARLGLIRYLAGVSVTLSQTYPRL